MYNHLKKCYIFKYKMKIQWNKALFKIKTIMIKAISVHFSNQHKDIIDINKIIKENNKK